MRKLIFLGVLVALAGCATRGTSSASVESGYSSRTYYDGWHSPDRHDGFQEDPFLRRY
jgi:hypothetical protein